MGKETKKVIADIQQHIFRTCRAESECLKQQQCNSTSPECPPSDPKENGLPCQDSTKVCNDGNCNGSVCAQVIFLTEY